jgi:hypothetical protein
MSGSVQEVATRLNAVVDQDQARLRDLTRLLELLRPLARYRGPAWWVLWRRLPAEQRAEVADLRGRLRLERPTRRGQP